MYNVLHSVFHQVSGTWERGNAHWGRVETPQNFGVFWGTGGREGIGVPNKGVQSLKLQKKRNDSS